MLPSGVRVVLRSGENDVNSHSSTVAPVKIAFMVKKLIGTCHTISFRTFRNFGKVT
eukprot:TRINITY_DN5033_c0_g1_i1.p1 TRINITY_DN5033_c0_g1~~TRINITY_DN5033_c0_g1_i1.p1  ORF type:complete len:56 (+),score=4.03 TRINITY_DN5033_c0_g1_i1:218-385(+)